MNEETTLTPRPEVVDHSRIFGVSLRGWIALMVTGTVCAMSVLTLDVKEPLYTLAGLIIGFYFAQSQSQKPK